MAFLRRERATGPLAIYHWPGFEKAEQGGHEIEQSDSQTEFTVVNLQPQRNPNEYQEWQDKQWEEEAEKAKADKRARKSAEQIDPLTESGHRTLKDLHELAKTRETSIFLPELEDDQANSLPWPGEERFEAGDLHIEQVDEPMSVDERIEGMEQMLADSEKWRFSIPFGQIAKNGLKKVSEIAASVRTPEIDVKKYAKIAKLPVAKVVNVIQEKYEQASDWTTDEKRQEQAKERAKKTAKVAAKAGAIALAGVGGIYFGNKYGSIAVDHLLGNSHEAAPAVTGHLVHNPAGDEKAIFAHHLSAADHFQAISAQANYHVHRAHQVLVQAGDGYTQVIQKLFPNHTPAEYLRMYKESISTLGPNFVGHIHHYHEAAKGFFGLSGTGKAEISQKAYNFLSSLSKANR